MFKIFCKILKYISIVILIFFIFGVMWVGYLWYENRDPQGGSNRYCISEELPPVSNKTGMVVTAHNTVCDMLGGNSAVYVYVHKLGQEESRKSLVFRYVDNPGALLPKFKWINDLTLRISVEDVSQVTKQLNMMDGVKITYVIGNEEYPRKN